MSIVHKNFFIHSSSSRIITNNTYSSIFILHHNNTLVKFGIAYLDEMITLWILCAAYMWLLVQLSNNVEVVAWSSSNVASSRLVTRGGCSPTALALENSQTDDEQEDLRSRAFKLRQEAEELEAKLRSTSPRKSSQFSTGPGVVVAPLRHRDMRGSTWTLTYRFASTPESPDGNAVSKKYTGKLRLDFRPDGYTDLQEHQPSQQQQQQNDGGDDTLDIVKAWGWDLETSEEDGKDYVLFSVDAIVPKTSEKTRYYFQARQEKDSEGFIELKEGTVTVKQDVTETKDGGQRFWGLFSPKGILARFTYVGDFVARPAVSTKDS